MVADPCVVTDGPIPRIRKGRNLDVTQTVTGSPSLPVVMIVTVAFCVTDPVPLRSSPVSACDWM